MTNQHLTNIINILQKGGVVLIPVDTVFGLICDGTNENAVKKVETIKHRTKPSFSFFVKDIHVAKKYAIFSEWQENCFKRVFPGYFTLILKASELAEKVLPARTLGFQGNYTTIGLRIPYHTLCIKILEHFNVPLLATSANISGQKTPICIDDVPAEIQNSVDYLYHDNNHKLVGMSSTIVNISDETNIKILRQGSGDIKLLQHLLSFK